VIDKPAGIDTLALFFILVQDAFDSLDSVCTGIVFRERSGVSFS